MKSKNDLPATIDAIDASEKNPAATSRRRLLQALGVVGASGLISLDWQRPVVSIGGLSAHAQGSLECGTAVVEIFMTKSGTGSITIIESRSDGTSPLSEFSFSDTVSASASGTGIGEAVTVRADASWAGGADLTFSVQASCCDEFFGSLSGTTANITSAFVFGAMDFGDDGACGVQTEAAVEGVGRFGGS